jgi:uncharacterized protein DUF3168
MFPPIFGPVDASPACRALLRASGGPTRFYQFGFAGPAPQKPYAVWQRTFGAPENYLGDLPDSDSFTLLVDVYASSADSARSVALALRDAIEPVAYITAWLGESVDPLTLNNRFSFQVDWIVPR